MTTKQTVAKLSMLTVVECPECETYVKAANLLLEERCPECRVGFDKVELTSGGV